MSRLIIKNLPKLINEDKLKKIFEEHGVVTDVQLKYKDGKFRQFAFIGFQNEDGANKAIQSLNNTYISTNKVTLQPCADLGDSNKPKSWSKHAKDSNIYKIEHNIVDKKEEKPASENKKKTKKNDTIDLLEKYKNDPMFEEFLGVHSNEAKAVENFLSKIKKSEQDDDNCEENNEEQGDIQEENNNEESENETKLANQQISDLDYMKQLIQKTNKPRQKQEKVKKNIDFFTIKLKGLPYNCKKKDVKVFFKQLKPQSIRVPTQIHGIAFVGFKDEKKMKKALLKDKSFLSGHQISVVKYDGNKKEEDKSADPIKAKWISQEESLKNEEEIAESGRIFVRNLAYTATEEDLRPFFEKFGPITELNLPIDSNSRKIKGFGTITFLMPEHAVAAYSKLDGSVFQGRMLHLLPAKSKDAPDNNLEEASNYKLKKAAQEKAKSGMSYNWNSLFLGHDAVAQVMADTFHTTKEAIMGPESKGNIAVKLALGETNIVTETKKYLEQHGVILDVFSSNNSKRSKTIILVKNLPSQTTIKEIRDIFEKFGILGRVILPPSGITAIVEFVEPSEARKAFTRLAYTKFKNMPLYLEWAPEDSLNNKTDQPFVNSIEQSVEKDKKKEDIIVEEKIESDDEEPEDDTTLFVKNLNFKTTDESLRKHFEKCGKIHYATVATKKDKNNLGGTLSLGYGFVRFKTKASTNKALKTLQQSVLDEKSLELKRSERTLQSEEIKKKSLKKTKPNGTKLLVKNVPFQANKKEISELFGVFGEIKALRMPKKLTGDTHRGYAFVDYLSVSDAKKAFEALSQSTHLYGRRLVLEWAELENDGITSAKRSAENFLLEDTTRKKSKKSVFSIDE